MANPSKTETEKIAPIIVKKVKKYAGGHHGGAWKVAYADFVTAMMAFFLLLWLLNVTTEEQKNAISNYFDPSHPTISDNVSGAGGVMGGTSVVSKGAMTSMVQSLARPEVPSTTKLGQKAGEFVKNDATGDGEKKQTTEEISQQELLQRMAEDIKKQEEQKFDEAKKKLEAEMSKSPELKELMKNLLVDVTPEGLRIQIIDDKGRSMFALGSAKMLPFTERLVQKVAEVVSHLPNLISVRGHTDSKPYKTDTGYDNWNLSADRAQATRRMLVGAGGLPEARIANVVGRADREHLLPSEPLSERNRRISIILLREDYAGKAQAKQAEQKLAEQQKQQAKGLNLVDDAQDKLPDMQAETSAAQDGTKAGGIPPKKSALPVMGLKGRTMQGVVTSSKRGAIIEDDLGPTAVQPEETEPQPYIAPARPGPTRVLQFD